MKKKTNLSTAAAIVITALSLSGAALAQGGAAGDGGGAAGTAHGPAVDSSGAMAGNMTSDTMAKPMKPKKMRHHKTSSITKDPNSTHMLGAHQGGAAADAGKDSLSGGEGGAGGSGGGGGN